VRFQPRHRVRIKTKRHDNRICWHHKLTARYRHRTATSLRIRFTQLRAQQANPLTCPFIQLS
jgi:hypothetical protein